MAEEIGGVAIKVNTDSVTGAVTALDALATRGPRVEKAVDGIGQASQRAGKSLANLGGGSVASLNDIARNSARAADGVEKLGRSASSVRQEIIDLGRSLIGFASARQFVLAADSVTALKNQLNLATGSAQAAANAYVQLFEIAQRSRVGFVELGKTFSSIARASESLKLSQQQLLTLTETIGNAITVSGSSAQASEAALVQLGQGLASGVLRGEELNSILEQTPRLAKALADGLGVSTGALRELGEEGRLTANAVITALRSQSEILAREVQGSVQTVAQSFTLMKNAATVLSGELDRVAGVSVLVNAAVGAAAQSFGDLTAAIKATSSAGTDFELVGDAVSTVFETISVLGANVLYVLTSTGRELGALAAQAAAIADGDFTAVLLIRDAVKADADRARKEIDDLSARILAARKLREQVKKDLGSVDTRAEDARLGRQAGNTTRGLDFSRYVDGAGKAKKATKDLGDEFATQRESAKQWADALQDFTRIQQDAQASTLDLTRGQKRLLEYLTSQGYEQASDEMRELALRQAYAAIAAEQNAAAIKETEKIVEEATKSYKAWREELDRGAESVLAQVDRMMLEEQAAQIAAAGYKSLAIVIQELEIARLRERQVAMMADEGAVASLQKEIEARERLIGLIGNKEAREASKKAADDAASEWKRNADKISDTLTDALMRGFEDGKGFADNFADTVKNLFKTMVLRPVIQATIAPFASSLSGAVSQAIGLGGVGDLFGAGSMGGSILNTGGIAGLGGLAGGSSLFGLGLQGSLAGFSELGLLGGASSAITSAGSLLSAGSLSGSLGAALPVIGPIAAGVALLSSLDHKKTPHKGASIVTDAMGNSTNDQGSFFGSTSGAYRWDMSTEVESALKGLNTSIAGSLNSLSKSFGGAGGFSVGSAFAADNEDASWGTLRLAQNGQTVGGFTDQRTFDSQSSKGFEQYAAQVAVSVRQAIDGIGLPTWAKSFIDSLGSAPSVDQLTAAVQQIVAAEGALKNLGLALPQFASLSGTAVDTILKSVGGIDGLASSVSSYYDAFTTQAEKTANTTKQVSEALASVGLAMPATRDEFAALLKSQLALGDSGAAAAAKLLLVSPAFASITKSTDELAQAAGQTAEQLAQAAEQVAEAGRRALESAGSEQANLMIELLRAQGDSAGAAAAERAAAIKQATQGLTDADKAAVEAILNRNAALRDEIDTINKAAEAERTRAAERFGLEGQILQLQGNTAALRERELAALDPANRAYQEMIYKLQDAAQVAQQFSSALDSLASTRFDLENQLLTLQGNPEEVARRQREQFLAEATKGLSSEEAAKIAAAYDKNVAIQREIEAAQAAIQAANEAARAAEQLKSAWQSVSDSIFGEVSRIRGLLGGNSAASLAQTQAQFAIASAQAKAGDQDAAKLLPSLSQTLLSLAEAQATSLLELQRIRAQTAASLESVGNTLSSRYGLQIPKFDVGTNYVPQDMVAVVHQGEAIVPRAFNPAAGGGGGGAGNAELIAEVKALRAQNKELASESIKLQERVAELLNRWEFGGLPKERAA